MLILMKEDPLNLTNLQYFCDAVKRGSVSASAKANFVTQSAISQGISKLEKFLKMSLVAHHPNRFRLTPEGEAFFDQALMLLKQATELKHEFSKGKKHDLGSLEFACTHSISLAIIPQYIKKFSTAHPKVKIHFRIARNEQIKQMLKQGEIDFGILPDEEDLDNFDKREIHRGYLRLYASSDIPKKEHKKLQFILAEPGCKERILLNESYLRKYRKELVGIMEVGSWEVMANLVANGIGIGYFPDYIVKKNEHRFKEVDLGLKLHQYRICAISPFGMHLRKSSEIFLSFFE